MSYELTHKSVISGRIREGEYEHDRQHILNDQATGMLVYASSATQLNGLPVGADNYILSVATDTPAWISPAALLADISPLTTRGDMLYRNATISTRLAKGADNTILAMGANDPEWKTPATIMADLSGQAAADFSMNTHKITAVTDPASAQDAATKNYVDTTAVLDALFDAHTILMAVTDDTPEALTVAASRIVGRKASGNIAAMTGAETLALLTGANLDVGAFDVRGQTVTADGLTSGRVVVAGASGVLSDDSDFTFSGDTLTITKIAATTFTGFITMTLGSAVNSHLLIAGTAKLNSGEQAIYVNFPSETVATNGIWITLGSTVTSGDLTGIRSRVTGNATSAGANVRGAYLEAKGGAGKYAAMLEGALIHADYSAGSVTVSGDVRGLTVHISQGTGLNAANLYGILVNIQTRGNETISSDDVGLMIRNEAVGGNGRQMDSGIKIAGLNMGGGTIPFLVDITFQNGTTLYDDGTDLTLAGANLVVPTLTVSGTSIFSGAVSGISLSEIENLEGDKTFTMANHNLTFNFTTPSEGLTLNVTGAFGDHILHIHQSSGNPSAGAELVHLQCVDSDIISLHIDHTGDNASIEQVRYQLNRANPANGDNILIKYYFDHDATGGAQDEKEFVRLTAKVVDVTRGSEDASYTIGLVKAGSMTDVLVVASTGLTITGTLTDGTATLTSGEWTGATLNAMVAKGTWTASGTWTIPAVTLNGNIVAGFSGTTMLRTDTDDLLSFRAGTGASGAGAVLSWFGKDHGNTGGFKIYTPNAAGNGDTQRLLISGVISTSVATWSNITHTGLVLSGALTINGQVFDAGSGSAQINTTGEYGGLLIKSTQGDAGGSRLTLQHVSASPDVDDLIGVIRAVGEDSNSNETTYGLIDFMITNPVDGSESCMLRVRLADSPGINIALTLSSAGALNLDSVLQAGAAMAATVAYNRFGAIASSHSLNSDDDLMVSGELEVKDSVYFDSAVYASSTIEITGASIRIISGGRGLELAGGDCKIVYQAADNNAKVMAFCLPHADEDADNVPVAVFGDLDILSVDLGFFNGITDPTIALVNAARTNYSKLTALGSLYLAEQAAATADRATQGQYWVKNLQGTVPMYTGDSGLDAAINRTIFTQTATKTHANSLTETTLFTTGVGTLTIPSNTLAVGNTIRIKMSGIYGTKNGGQGNITINVTIGGVSIGTHMDALNANETNEGWFLEAIITVRSLGGSGTVQGQAFWTHEFSQGGETADLGAFEITATTTIDTTGALVLDVTADFSVQDNANTISCTNASVEILN